MKVTSKPELRISQIAWDKIWALTNMFDFEVSCLGIMSATNANYLVDVIVVSQEGTPASTTMDPNEVAEVTAMFMESGRDPALLSCWQHSHANQSVFWSGTDEANIERYESDTVLWSIVTNRKAEIKVRADIWKPIRQTFDDCGYEVDYPDTDLVDWCKEVKPLVKRKPVITPRKTWTSSSKGRKGNLHSKTTSSSKKKNTPHTLTQPTGSTDSTPEPKKTTYGEVTDGNFQIVCGAILEGFDEGVIDEAEAIEWNIEIMTGGRTRESVEAEVLSRIVQACFDKFERAPGAVALADWSCAEEAV